MKLNTEEDNLSSMEGTSQLINKNLDKYLEKNKISHKTSKNRIGSENGDVTNSTEDNHPLMDEGTASMLCTGIPKEGGSCSNEEEDSGSGVEENSDEAEEESTKAYGELVAVLQNYNISLSVLDEPQTKSWLEKYTGVYRSSWHS
ncbi:hypothetical protein SMKI_12G1910 [Saccharomyces mikatae IFO 1815]|uniref:Uncharacterized protein n=1 Tax=Saccharomyces mikatae IFO 1815 TaxID=226126 RepID=A0AA35NEF2_SACMI|nr:uncharacterized protein SMKI_12G1910 [Saccharomyces mikatae IFO 1815]CAI4035053.1 hypothetical protein SMKI_12G1910 [Saccharomyces mikatae IFO 1815]